MTHTVDTLMALADEYTRLCTFMQDGTTAKSAKIAREALRTALTEALQPVREPLTDEQMLQFRRDALEEAADIIKALEKEIEQHKETNLNQSNKIMKILNEKVILQNEIERLEPLQF